MGRPHILTTIFMKKKLARNKLLPLWNSICVSASIPYLHMDINGTFILLYIVQIECTDGILLACNRIFSIYYRSTHKKKQLVIKFNDSQSILVIMLAMITAKWQWNGTEINKCKKISRQLSDERSCFWECKWNYFKLLKIPIGVNENAISNANDTYAAALFFN